MVPKATPIKRLTIKPIMGLLAPTAATAAVFSAPVKLPTTAISEALNSCSKMAVAATGSAKRGNLLQMGPCSMSSLCARIRQAILLSYNARKV